MIVAARYNGPPGSGNGGYTAGLVAAEVAGPGPVEVTLRQPPPLDTSLSVEPGPTVRVYDGSRLVAEALPVESFDATVPAVTLAAATGAAAAYPGFAEHPFPTCFVCGPQRDDGLGVFPGPLPDGRTAAPVRVPDGVEPALVWAMLDCPGGWAIISPGRPYVLGRMAAAVAAMPHPGDVCVVVGQAVSVHGRKALVHSTLYGPDGTALATARATWLAVRP